MKKLNNIISFTTFAINEAKATKETESESLDNDFNTTIISKLKKGDYFRLPKKKVVYVYDGYNRSEKTYDYYRFDDISAFGSKKKKDTAVEIDFTF